MAAPPSLLGQPKAVWRQPPLSGVLTPVRADGSGARSIDCGARALATGREGRSTPAAPASASSRGVGMRRRPGLGVSSTCLDPPEASPSCRLGCTRRPNLAVLLAKPGVARSHYGEGLHTRHCFACYGSSNGQFALSFGRARRRAALHRGNTSSLPRAKKTRPASTRRRGKDPIRPAKAPRSRGTT